MGKPTGFIEIPRETPTRRPIPERVNDYLEVYNPFPDDKLRAQGARCMDCGIPFCHQGCPLGNLIPDWNDLVYRDQWRLAIDRLHQTNNFPEFTGRLCPAPCEASCVLGINSDPVTIKQMEVGIIDRAWDEGWVQPEPPKMLTGKRVAVVGSGPAGLACAQQLARAGHAVTVFERADRIGGLLRYGIPDFKMEKHLVDRRVAQLEAEGTRFRPGVEIGVDLSWSDLRARYDAVLIATGATVPRDLPIPGRDLPGVHFAMDYLVQSNRAVAGDAVPDQLTAEGKHVVVIGGGDTGSDCIGTAHRQGALSVTSLAIGRRPGDERSDDQPWPTQPTLFEVQSSHEEGGERTYLASTVEFLSDEHGALRALRVAETAFVDGRRVPQSGTEREIPAELVLLAMGFTGPETGTIAHEGAAHVSAGGRLRRDGRFATSEPGVYIAGDAGRGQSLIVWAIAEGRAAAASIDHDLMGDTALPTPVSATDVALRVQPA